MKVKSYHLRDFMAYVDFNFIINGSLDNPRYFCPAPYSLLEKGMNETIKCFVEYESTGKISKLPDNPQLLKLALDGKKILNWHIEQWAIGISEGTMFAWEIKDYLFSLPDWVCDALNRQVNKIKYKKDM